MAHLALQSISVQFGGLKALSKLSFSIRPGEILGLIGPNGAGKTTVFNVLTGVCTAAAGDVRFEARSILNRRPHEIFAMGIARTFQNIRLFSNMTALENAMVARHARSKIGVFGAVFRTRRQQREEERIRAEAYAALKFMGVEMFADTEAGNLPYGHQRRLEIARALASQPKILLLDEPAAGMNPAESQALIKDIGRICDLGIDVLLVEHDMKVIMGVCHRIVCVDRGVKIAEGLPEEIRRDTNVIEAYLGQPAADLH